MKRPGLVLLVASLFLVMIISQIAAYPHPVDNDMNQGGSGTTGLTYTWYIDGGLNLTYANQTIGIIGDVQINDTGRLNLNNVTLLIAGDLLVKGGGELYMTYGKVKIQCASNGEHKIDVDKHGYLDAHNTTFTHFGGGLNFTFEVQGNISLRDCDISYTSESSLMIGPTSGVTLSTVAGGYPNFAHFIRCEFHDNYAAGMSIKGGRRNTHILNCTFRDQERGIFVTPNNALKDVDVHGSHFHDLTDYGIAYSVSFFPAPDARYLNLSHCLFESMPNGLYSNCAMDNFTITHSIFRSITNNGVKVLADSSLTFAHNRFVSCFQGLNTSADMDIDNCTFITCGKHDISVMNQATPRAISTYYNMSNCHFSPTAFIINLWYLNVTVSDGASSLPGALVTVNDSTPATVFTGMAGPTGIAEWIMVEEGKISSNPTYTTPHNISGVAPTFLPGYLDVSVHDNMDVTVYPLTNGAPTAPSNIIPNATHDLTPRIDWDASTDPESHGFSYMITIFNGTTNGADKLVDNHTLTNTFYEVTTPLEYHRSYLVRVYAQDIIGGYSFGETVMDVVNNAPTAPEISAAPTAPLKGQDITFSISKLATDADTLPDDIIYYTYTIMKNDAVYTTLANATVLEVIVPANDTTIGDVFEASVVAWDGIDPSPATSTSVTVVNGEPVVATAIDTYAFNEDTTGYISLGSLFTDADGDTLVVDTTSSDHIAAVVLTNGSLKLQPDANWFGTEIITISGSDSLAIAYHDINITVRPVNDVPTNNNFSFRFWKTNPNNVTFTAKDGYDIDGDTLIYQWDYGDGTNGEGKVPVHNYEEFNVSKDYVVTLTVFDGTDHSLPTSMTITIAAVEEEVPNGTDGGDGGDGGTTDGGDGGTTDGGDGGTTDGGSNDGGDGGVDGRDGGSDDSTMYGVIAAIIIVIVLLVIIGAVVFFVMRAKKEEPEEEVQKEEPEEDEEHHLSDIAYASSQKQKPSKPKQQKPVTVRKPKTKTPPPKKEEKEMDEEEDIPVYEEEAPTEEVDEDLEEEMEEEMEGMEDDFDAEDEEEEVDDDMDVLLPDDLPSDDAGMPDDMDDLPEMEPLDDMPM